MFKPVTPNVNFPEMEKKILDYWYSSGVIKKYLNKNNKSKKRFSFLDGPITANNPMGVHHAWGRTYKDLWQKFNNMRGFKERFQNGFDCQGLWIEVEVEKELGLRNKKEIENLVPGNKIKSIAKFVRLCKERVLKFSKIQTEQSIRLGNFMNWDHSYYTMSDENNYMIWYFLKTCHEKGWIYKGKDSVPWCPRCETAISQHEMLTEDYKEITHKSIYMRFPLENKKNEYLLVWTTTPWTIPANIAVAVDKTFEYVLVEDDKKDLYWVQKEAKERLFQTSATIKKTVKGISLVGLKYQGAFDDLESVKKAAESPAFHTIISTDPLIMPITTSEGTGMVHTAVSAGEEDFKLGKKLGLPLIPVITDNADYLSGLGFLSGKNAKKHPEIILDHMTQKGFSFKIENYTHRYPACWRCKTELVWKVAEEWYIAMDRPSRKASGSKRTDKTLREMMINTAKMIDWHPKFGLERELDWLENMHDWLISKKNRYWGLALPIYECSKCGWFEVIGSKEELEKKAISGWDEFKDHTPHKPYIDEVKIKCGNCGKTVQRIDDVGNVWLDAGIVPFSTYIDPESKKLSYTTDKKYWREWFPADFITESFPGQFKNWFYSMIAMSTVLEKQNPFKTVLGYASMLGEDARPMHKSWGNAIDFNEGADKIGVDVMRWMFVTHDPEQNLLFGYKKADEVRRQFHLRLWNIYNFLISYAGVDGWKPSKDKKINIKNILDEWILTKLNLLITEVTDSMEKYDAFTASNKIEEFVGDLSVWYVRRSRDRVGPTAENNPDKDMTYTTLYQVLIILVKLLAPFTPFMTDEIYRNLTNEESVHLTDWPTYAKATVGKAQLIKNMELARKICELGHAKRKELGIKVRQPLRQLSVISCQLSVNKELIQLIKDELNVKEVMFAGGKGEITVELDTELTPELISEGKARELVRQIQLKRKELGCRLDEKIILTLSEYPNDFEEYIIKETLGKEIKNGSQLAIDRV